jgi:hypothetical protein
MLGRQLLARVAEQVLQVGSRDLQGAAPVHHAVHPNHRILRENADRWHHHVKSVGAELSADQLDLILEGEQCVPISRCAKVVVAARPPVSSTGTELKQLANKDPGLILVPTGLLQRVTPRREVTVAPIPRGFRVRNDAGNARSHEVVPVTDALGIPFRTMKRIVEV